MTDHNERHYRRTQNTFAVGILKANSNESTSVSSVQGSNNPLTLHTHYMMQHYGFASAPMMGCHYASVAVSGDPSKGIVVGTNDNRYRPTGLNPGESVIYDNAGQSIHLMNGQFISANVQQGFMLNVGGNLILQITQNAVVINANVQINGTLNTTGEIESGNIMLTKHVHTGVQSGSSTTGLPTG